jgi:hypothetical protein
VTGTANATGGGSQAGAGGAATASVTAHGGSSVTAQSMASGGSGDTSGAASATTNAYGTGGVTATSSAIGGYYYASNAGPATAQTTASGVSGSYAASATISTISGLLVTDAAASAGGGVDGTSLAVAGAEIGGLFGGFVTGAQSVGQVDGAPIAAVTNAVLGSPVNAGIKAAFGASAVFFGVGELGGGYSAGGTTSQTATSQFSETVDLTKLASRTDLEVGLLGGVGSGTGVTDIEFDLMADGVAVLTKSFASAAAAQAYFTDNAIDLGSLASGAALGADSLTLSAVISVTSDAGHSGFYGGLVLGESSPAMGAGAHPALLAQAAAGFGASAAGLAAGGAHHGTIQPLLAVAGHGARA